MILRAVGACLLFVCVMAQDPGFNDTCVEGKYPPPAQRQVKEYVINLDLPPEQRWQKLASEKRHEIVALILEFKKFLMEWASGEIITIVDFLGENIDDTLPNPYRDEIKGMANATGIFVGELFVYNIFYELFTVCTSIVAQDPAGKMYHARNLDFGLFLGWDPKNRTWQLTDVLRPAIVNLDWQRGGKTVFKSVNYAGYVGVLTAIKQNKFTFSMDERFGIDGGYLGILEWIRDKKGSWMSFLSRETMEYAPDFAAARDKLANTQLIAPAYFILGGTKPGEGAVITRNREVNGTDVWMMTDKTAGGWYVLETNYDHWKKPLFLDDRRDPANKCMQKMSIKNTGFAGLFNVLSSKPVLNKLTTYSALMQVDSGTLETWLQYCPDPCEPW
ncbi:acid ceramidase-like [Mercenaria mercenaria]|uniref:acid ceramidase-like n=1 Tax=Mercenaria mercenaria TaxID=6596 RepID=UPI00234F3E0D|nr:acid ceramidase-like [Mercenaria mercenaria]